MNIFDSFLTKYLKKRKIINFGYKIVHKRFGEQVVAVDAKKFGIAAQTSRLNARLQIAAVRWQRRIVASVDYVRVLFIINDGDYIILYNNIN